MLNSTKAKIFITFGACTLAVYAQFKDSPVPELHALTTCAFLIGYPCFIMGCCYFARHRGYSGFLGGFLGLFTLIGVGVLALLPNRKRRTSVQLN